MKYCRKCKYPNPDSLQNCYKCGASLANARRYSDSQTLIIGSVMLVIITGLIVFSVISLVRLCNTHDNTEDLTVYEDRFSAFFAAEDLVKDILKAPSTAEFAGINDEGIGVTYLGGNRYIVQSFVDSENGFGARIRTHFQCKIRRSTVDPDKWYLEDFVDLADTE